MSKKIIGVLAGNGDLPELIAKNCHENSIKSVFAFIDIKPNFKLDNPYIITSIGQVGKILKFFKKQQVTHIILAGGVKKPNFYKLKVDFRGSILLGKILKNKLLGDNALLTTIINYLEKFKYEIISVNKFLPNLHLSLGNNNDIEFNKKLNNDIEFGIELINNLSPFDVGQAVIIQNNRVIAIEAAEGTDKMIIRCKDLIDDNPNYPAILVKLKKVAQDNRVDLPTIGVETINNLIASNIRGIVLDAKNAIVINKEEVIRISEQNNIFIYGITNNNIS